MTRSRIAFDDPGYGMRFGLESAMAAWAPGFTWRNPGHAYSRAAVDLEGCVHDPGGMVVPLHLLVPAGERRRWWLEQMVHIRAQERRPLFSWGFGPN